MYECINTQIIDLHKNVLQIDNIADKLGLKQNSRVSEQVCGKTIHKRRGVRKSLIECCRCETKFTIGALSICE